MSALGYNIGDRWSHRGFRLACRYYGVEISKPPEALSLVFAHRQRAEEAIDEYLASRALDKRRS